MDTATNKTVIYFNCACNDSATEKRSFLAIKTTVNASLEVVCQQCANDRKFAFFFKKNRTPNGTSIRFQAYELIFIRWLLKPKEGTQFVGLNESMLLNDMSVIPVVSYLEDGIEHKVTEFDL